MACDLTTGRTEPCKDSIGGIQAVYFINYQDQFRSKVNWDASNTDVVESFDAGAATAYKYEVKDASSYTENIQSNREAGTTIFEQVLELTLKKLSVADHKQIKFMSWGRPIVIIKDNNDNCFLAGLDHGMEVTGGTIATGNAKGDLSGYTLTLTGMEQAPAHFLEVDVESITGLTISS